jgi:hypothetical protein
MQSEPLVDSRCTRRELLRKGLLLSGLLWLAGLPWPKKTLAKTLPAILDAPSNGKGDGQPDFVLDPVVITPLDIAPVGAMTLPELAGERLTYNVSFWIFSRAGNVSMTFRPLGESRFEALMQGQTSGVIGWFTRYRQDRYRSVMEYDPQAGRLRPLHFEEKVVIGKEVRRQSIIDFDYARGLASRKKIGRRGEVSGSVARLNPAVPYDDYLSGIYNLRLGAYGALQEGRTYELRLLKADKERRVRIVLAGPEENRKRLGSEGNPGEKFFFSHIYLPKGMLDSKTGEMEGWFSARAVPVGGTIRDMALFGDVTGRLVKRERA